MENTSKNHWNRRTEWAIAFLRCCSVALIWFALRTGNDDLSLVNADEPSSRVRGDSSTGDDQNRTSRISGDNTGGTRWALLVGVDEYTELEKLRYCGADMRALRDQLIATGFPERQVFLLEDKAVDKKYLPFKSSIERQLDIVLKLVLHFLNCKGPSVGQVH